MITVDRITRRYGSFTAVDAVSFDISPGEIVGLLGHNGAGKTTIMKMMTGYLESTEGSIAIDGLDVARNRRMVQEKIGYLPENCPVYPEMSVIDYLDYAAALHGLGAAERAPLIREALERTALVDRAYQSIATLSRGYRQRTGVAQAILHRPRFLILDEPTNGLDPTQIQHMRSLIADLAKTATVIISTHILQEVQAVCDRVIILKDGAKVLDSRLDDLQKNTKLLLSISADRDDAIPFLLGLDGISAAYQITPEQRPDIGHAYALVLENEEDREQKAATLARTIHQNGWQLFSMNFEARTLETVFAEISAQ